MTDGSVSVSTMKARTRVLFALGVALGVPALFLAARGILQAQAAQESGKPMRVAVVDTQRVFDQYTRTQTANKTLEDAVKRLEDQGKSMNAEIARMEEQLTKQRLFIDDASKIQQMERDIAQKRSELRQFVTTGEDALREKQDELAQPILEEIRTTIQSFGKENGYSLVIEKQLIALYHEPDMDVTEALVKLLNDRAAASAKSSTDATQGTPATGSR
ncbi:OmpH family outer membrane protein [Candidatus Poribacteria bacterium]|nr:OmpH family outer membrane protein [Candidatus Poribacteria bacterium]